MEEDYSLLPDLSGLAKEETLAKLLGFEPNDIITINVIVDGDITTYVKTNGVKTRTISINRATGVVSKEWS